MRKAIGTCFILLYSLLQGYAQTSLTLPISEDFERDTAWIWPPWQSCTPANSSLSRGCARSGNLGLNCINDCFVRTDIVVGKPGEVISYWVRFQQNTNAYLGFGIKHDNNQEKSIGYYLCVAPEQKTFDFRKSPDYTYPRLKSVSQTYKMHTWYKVELSFETQTKVTGRLYSSDGTTLLNTLTHQIPDLSPGGIFFRGHFLHVDEMRVGSTQDLNDNGFVPVLGVPINFKNVEFESNKSVMLTSANGELNKLVAYLKSHPQYSVLIMGHTDNAGDNAFNKQLSIDRAAAVRDYLVNKGVNAKSVSYIGFGSSKPIASNQTAEGQQKNRRVEFVLNLKK